MTHCNCSALLVLLGTLALQGGTLLARQAQPATPAPRDSREVSPDPVGTATISGVVSVSDTGQPARRARVTISSGEARVSRNVMTNDSGQFVFAALPAGRYSLSASKPGHVGGSYGQRRPGPGRPGTAIQLADAQKLQVQLHITRGGVITGTVLDEHGEALPGTPVRALRYVMQNGERTIQQAGNGSTDDRGIYRLYGLQPGEYLVTAIPRNNNPAGDAARMQVEVMAMREQASALIGSDPERAKVVLGRLEALRSVQPASEEPVTGYAPIYYPGTTTPSSAGTVAVGAGEEKMGVDFQLQLVPIARVEGVVVTGSGPTPGNISVTLINSGQEVPGLGTSSTRVDGNGRFRLSNVAPGQYTLVARGTIGGGRGGGRGEFLPGQPPTPARGRGAQADGPEPVRLWAMTEVSVDGRTVSNLVLTLQPGMTVSGRVVFEGTATPPADLSRLRVSVTPMDVSGPAREIAGSAAGRVDASGRFTIPGVVPGRYRITSAGATQGWFLASSIVSGQDTLDFPIEVKPSQSVSGAVLTFHDRQSELTGTIVDDKGQAAPDYTIIVYPTEREFWTPRSRRIFSQRPGTDGRFTFRSLPPGDYRIAPVLDPEPGTWFDPAFLQQLDATALRVPIGQGEKKVQNLRIAGQ